MSMLSAQYDELRELALWLDDEFYDVEATKVRDAADTICELRNKCSNLMDERETAEHNLIRNMREYARMCHENDKLRELVRDLYEMAYPECPSAFETAFADRMRELEVEVDA